MKTLARIAVLGAVVEVGCWLLASVMSAGSWRYNISYLYAWGAPRPWLVMAGETAFAIGLAALALGLHRALPASDHGMVACALLVLASMGTLAGALARNNCEESVPQCEGESFATTGDWVHGVGSLVEIFGIAGAAVIVAAKLPRRWATYSAVTGCAALVSLFVWAAVPYPWVGTAERVLALALVGWVAAMGSQLAAEPPFSGRSRRWHSSVHVDSPTTKSPRAPSVTRRAAGRTSVDNLANRGWLVVVGVVLTVAGCDGSGSATSRTAGVEDSFAATALSACAKAQESKDGWSTFPVSDFDPSSPDAADLPQVGVWLEEEVAPTFDGWLDDLTALGEPSTGRAPWAEVLNLVGRIDHQNAVQIEVAKARDTGAFAGATKALRDLQPELERAAAAAGVETCADVHAG